MLRTRSFTCRPFAISHKDANVIIRKTGQRGVDLADASTPEIEDTALAAAQILRILLAEDGSSRPTILLIVRRHRELSRELAQHDPYRGLGFGVAGCLYHASYEAFEVIAADAVVCPFARTEYSSMHSLAVPTNLVHVLPLARVRHVIISC